MRIRLTGVPCELAQHFDPRQPILVRAGEGGLETWGARVGARAALPATDAYMCVGLCGPLQLLAYP